MDNLAFSSQQIKLPPWLSHDHAMFVFIAVGWVVLLAPSVLCEAFVTSPEPMNPITTGNELHLKRTGLLCIYYHSWYKVWINNCPNLLLLLYYASSSVGDILIRQAIQQIRKCREWN